MIKYLLMALALATGPAFAAPVYADSFESLLTIDFTNDNKGPIPVTDTRLNGNKLTAKCTNLVNGTCSPASTVPPVTPPVTPPPQTSCDLTPAGWTHVNKTYQQVFKNFSPWTSPSYLVPVGSFTTGQSVTGKIISVKATIGTKNINISFAGSQPVSAAGYGGGYPAEYAGVSINRCKGEITIPRVGDTTRCAMVSGSLEGRLIFGPTAYGGCRIPAGTDVWISFWFPSRVEPTNPAKNGCQVDGNFSGGTKCNVNVSVN